MFFPTKELVLPVAADNSTFKRIMESRPAIFSLVHTALPYSHFLHRVTWEEGQEGIDGRLSVEGEFSAERQVRAFNFSMVIKDQMPTLVTIGPMIPDTEMQVVQWGVTNVDDMSQVDLSVLKREPVLMPVFTANAAASNSR